MNMQTLALAFLAATAIGGLAWVFIYPLLSGEKKAESRRRVGRADRTRRRASGRQEPALAPRAGRGIAEGARGAPPEGKDGSRCSIRLTQAGLDLDAAEILDHLRRSRRGRGFVDRVCWSAADCLAPSAWHSPTGFGLPRWAAGLPQEAPGEGVPEGAAGRRRRHRARHQGRPAAVRIDQGRRRRRAGAAAGASSWPSSKPRRSACRSAKPARGCTNGCRCRRRTSSAS